MGELQLVLSQKYFIIIEHACPQASVEDSPEMCIWSWIGTGLNFRAQDSLIDSDNLFNEQLTKILKCILILKIISLEKHLQRKKCVTSVPYTATFCGTTALIHLRVHICFKYAHSNFCEIKANKPHNYLYFDWKISITDFDGKTFNTFNAQYWYLVIWWFLSL